MQAAKLSQMILNRLIKMSLGSLLIMTMCSSLAHASFMYECDVKAQVTQVQGGWTDQSELSVHLHILESRTRPGAHADLCATSVRVGAVYPVKITAEGSPPPKIIKDQYLNLIYDYVDSEGGSGATWTLSSTYQPSKAELIKYQEPAEPRARVVEHFAKIEDQLKSSSHYHVSISEREAHRGFMIHCPRGERCDGAYDYRMYTYHQDQFNLTLSFDAQVVGKESLETLRAHFKYVTLEANLFPFEFSGWRLKGEKIEHLHEERDQLGAKIKLTGYNNGRLRGELTTSLEQLSATNFRPPCTPLLDQAEPAPECVVKSRERLPIKITFDLPLMLGILDCTGLFCALTK